MWVTAVEFNNNNLCKLYLCSHSCADMIELEKRGKEKEKDIMFRFIKMSLEKEERETHKRKIDFHILK